MKQLIGVKNEELLKKMSESFLEEANTTKNPDKEYAHGLQTAMWSQAVAGDYPIIILGLANEIENNKRKELVELYRENAHSMWEELFGTYPPPWKKDANDKEEPFPFVEVSPMEFIATASKVEADRFSGLEDTNCRRAAFDFVMCGVTSLIAGSMTIPIILIGVAWDVWNGGEEILINEYAAGAKEFWKKHMSDVEFPY